MPGAAMIQMALEAIRKTMTETVNTVQEVVFRRPCLIDKDTTLRLIVWRDEKRFSLSVNGLELCGGNFL